MNSLKLGLLAATAIIAGPALAAAPADVLSTYGDVAQAKYADSLATAKSLKTAIDKLVAEPTEANLEAARAAAEARLASFAGTLAKGNRPVTHAEMGQVGPDCLVAARNLAHRAVQWPTRTARANLEARSDDSHSNQLCAAAVTL